MGPFKIPIIIYALTLIAGHPAGRAEGVPAGLLGAPRGRRVGGYRSTLSHPEAIATGRRDIDKCAR